MTNFKIKLNKETFYINKGKSVIGDIYFSVGDWYFPEKYWDDFVVVMLYWLTKELVELSVDKNKIIDAPFMEGDFKIYISLDDKKNCTINFVKGDSFADQEEVILKTITTPFEDLKNEVKKACEVLLHMKENKELDFEKDYEELKESYDLLCKI